MAKKQSSTERLLSAVSRLEENVARLEGVLNRMMIRLESLERNGSKGQKHHSWTWEDAGISQEIVAELQELNGRLTGRRQTALTLMLQTHGRLDFEDFARAFENWVTVSQSGQPIINDASWGSCRRDLNHQLREAEIPVEITKPKGQNEVILRLLDE